MMNIRLERPDKTHIEEILRYKEEFISNGDSSIDGSSGLQTAQDLEEWLENVQKCSSEETVPDGLVPSSTYVVYNEQDELIGMIDIRHYLNEKLFQSGGHIGYSVRPSKRRQGYATCMLELALGLCKDQLKIDRVLLTCNSWNTASIKVILANGGVLEPDENGEDSKKRRYWINIG